jgi:hypothetical protein
LQVRDRASQAINPGDEEHVAFADEVEDRLQLLPLLCARAL